MAVIQIITDGGRRRHWSAAENLRIVEEALDGRVNPLPDGHAALELMFAWTED